MTSYNQDGKSGPWATEKWAVLQRYLDAYSKVLKNSNYKTYYIDAFAGTGMAEIRAPTTTEAPLLQDYIDDPEYQQFKAGSALTALNTAYPFDGYLFCEPDPVRAAALRETVETHSLYERVRIREEPARDALRERVVNNPRIDWRYSRAVCFLDPFALQVEWVLVEELASTNAIEVIINFPLGMAIQRLLPNNVAKSEKHRDKLNAYFGGSEWFNIVYPHTESLFGNEPTKSPNAGNILLDWYRQKLKEAFGHVSPARTVRNTKGSPLYYLIWAGPHAKGGQIADHILKMGNVSTQ